MVLKSHAKINLSLTVNRKLSNGLHNIQSFFCLINIFDRISIKRLKNEKRDKIHFSGPFSKQVKNSKNTIQKVLEIMKKNKLINNYYSVKVYKKIPVFSGLGGGTSNAASVFKFLLREKVEKKIFNKIVSYVGSDFRLFFYKQAFLKNLQKIEELNIKYKLYFLVVYPNIKSSTKEVYSKIRSQSANKSFSKKITKSKDMFINNIKRRKNDLQLIVEKKHPIIRKLLNSIFIEKGCYFSRMTGSGSSCYGLFINENCSKAALSSLRKKYPKFWFSIAKTI